MRENPAISDWVRISKGLTEGLLGGGLAQRQAALRGVMAAGARFNFALVSRACRLGLEHVLCHVERFSGSGSLFDVRRGRTEGLTFNQNQVAFEPSYFNPLMSRNGRAIQRPCSPKFATNQDGTFGIQF